MKLKNYMDKQGKSIEEVALQTGFSYEDIRRYRHGLVVPRPDRIIKFQEWSKGEITAADWIYPANDNERE